MQGRPHAEGKSNKARNNNAESATSLWIIHVAMYQAIFRGLHFASAERKGRAWGSMEMQHEKGKDDDGHRVLGLIVINSVGKEVRNMETTKFLL